MMPIGSIAVWIGWDNAPFEPSDFAQACDGTNGTPDLTGCLVPGAGGSFDPGETGEIIVEESETVKRMIGLVYFQRIE